jgi:hypothetical protein
MDEHSCRQQLAIYAQTKLTPCLTGEATCNDGNECLGGDTSRAEPVPVNHCNGTFYGCCFDGVTSRTGMGELDGCPKSEQSRPGSSSSLFQRCL